jgi:hypothetical protein
MRARPGSRIAPGPAAASAAPTTPPTSACEELTGMRHHQVRRFQPEAAARAVTAVASVTASGRTVSAPSAWDTAPPTKKGPAKLAAAASASAPRAPIACEAMMVHTMLAPSWKPFTNS